MKVRHLTASIIRDGDMFVAQCLEVDVASQGKTEEEALANLREAIELRFDDEAPESIAPPVIRHLDVQTA